MSDSGDRAIAISKLTELCEIQGMRAYVMGYLSAHLATEDLEKAVHSAMGFWERIAEDDPHNVLTGGVSPYDVRD